MAAGHLDPGLLDELVTQARAGSGSAFTQLWERLAPIVHGYVRGRGVLEPDDVTSEVFLAAFQGLPRFVGDGKDFRRWLFTIAHHRAVDALRQQVRHVGNQLYDADRDARRTGSAEDDAVNRLAAIDALALLERLPEDHKNVLLLRVVAELPVSQVALILDRSPQAVRQLQHRAITRLRRELATSRPPTSAPAPSIRRP